MFTKSRRGFKQLSTSTACLLKNEPTSYIVQLAKQQKVAEPIAKASMNSAQIIVA